MKSTYLLTIISPKVHLMPCASFLTLMATSQILGRPLHSCMTFQSLHLLQDCPKSSSCFLHYPTALLCQIISFSIETYCNVSHLKNKLSLDPISSSAPALFPSALQSHPHSIALAHSSQAFVSATPLKLPLSKSSMTSCWHIQRSVSVVLFSLSAALAE